MNIIGWNTTEGNPAGVPHAFKENGTAVCRKSITRDVSGRFFTKEESYRNPLHQAPCLNCLKREHTFEYVVAESSADTEERESRAQYATAVEFGVEPADTEEREPRPSRDAIREAGERLRKFGEALGAVRQPATPAAGETREQWKRRTYPLHYGTGGNPEKLQPATPITVDEVTELIEATGSLAGLMERHATSNVHLKTTPALRTAAANLRVRKPFPDTRKAWGADPVQVTVEGAHRWSRDLNPVCEGLTYEVFDTAELGDSYGKHDGRRIVTRMTPDQARARALALLSAADEAERKNKEI